MHSAPIEYLRRRFSYLRTPMHPLSDKLRRQCTTSINEWGKAGNAVSQELRYAIFASFLVLVIAIANYETRKNIEECNTNKSFIKCFIYMLPESALSVLKEMEVMYKTPSQQ